PGYWRCGEGNDQGRVMGREPHVYPLVSLDSPLSFSVILKGGPAMNAGDFGKWKQTTLLGISLKVVAPTGQYDPTKLIIWGKPLGYQARDRFVSSMGALGV